MRNNLEVITDIDLPKMIKDEVLDSKNIDKQVSDECFKKYSNAEIYENRTDIGIKYDNMTKDEKIKELRELGYRLDVVLELIKNETAGRTAYVNGKRNDELCNVVSEMDTQRDSNNNFYENVFSELMPISLQVQQARSMLDNAKQLYDNAVTLANDIIDRALKAREEYDLKVIEIKENSGDNPNSWTDNDILQYNEITEKYNRLVREANIEAFNVKTKKEDYEEKKKKYEELKRKFSEEALLEVKNEVEEKDSLRESQLSQISSMLVEIETAE